jgi:hypothetical protein
VIVAVGNGCTAGIVLLVAGAALLLVVTTWPAYVLGLFRLPDSTVTRVERAVVKTSIALSVAATAGVVFLALDGC